MTDSASEVHDPELDQEEGSSFMPDEKMDIIAVRTVMVAVVLTAVHFVASDYVVATLAKIFI